MGQGDALDADLAAVAEDLERLVRRLRSLSAAAWRDRRELVRKALAGLVALAANLEDRQLDPPEVADHILADAIAVIGGDVVDRLAEARNELLLGRLRELLEAALAGTR